MNTPQEIWEYLSDKIEMVKSMGSSKITTTDESRLMGLAKACPKDIDVSPEQLDALFNIALTIKNLNANQIWSSLKTASPEQLATLSVSNKSGEINRILNANTTPAPQKKVTAPTTDEDDDSIVDLSKMKVNRTPVQEPDQPVKESVPKEPEHDILSERISTGQTTEDIVPAEPVTPAKQEIQPAPTEEPPAKTDDVLASKPTESSTTDSTSFLMDWLDDLPYNQDPMAPSKKEPAIEPPKEQDVTSVNVPPPNAETITPTRTQKVSSDRNTEPTLVFDQGTQKPAIPTKKVNTSIMMPNGFGAKNTVTTWNTPIITDFGFPFVNFSSEALLNIVQSDKNESVKNAALKNMFKTASKKYGGVWRALYAAPLKLIKEIATHVGTKCTPNYLKVDGYDLMDSEPGENITVIPIDYYSVDVSYLGALNVPRDYLSAFYDVIDYSQSSQKIFLKFAEGLSAQEFAEEIDSNQGIPPFYVLVPKKAKFSKCKIPSGSLLGSLMNMVLGRQSYTLVKTIYQGKRGCLAMASDIANKLFSDV